MISTYSFFKIEDLRKTNEVPSTIQKTDLDFVLYNTEGEQIDFKNRIRQGFISSTKERIFLNLENRLEQIRLSYEIYEVGKILIAGGHEFNRAIAIFNFQEKENIILEKYIESRLLNLIIIESHLIDVDNDTDLDIFAIGDSADNRLMRTAWVLINDNNEYLFATLLSTEGVDRNKAITGEYPAENLIDVQSYHGARAIFLRDLDNDKILELITLDNLTPAGEEDNTKRTKRVYTLKDNVYVLQAQSQINIDSQEYKDIISWQTIPDILN